MTAISYLAQPSLKIDGTDASEQLKADIIEISVEESIHQPGMFSLIINNDYFPGTGDPWGHEKLFAIGKAIEIGFSSSTTEAPEFSTGKTTASLFKGEITSIECSFTENSEATMLIRGYDVGHRLHRGRYNRSFQNMSDTDILKKVIGEVGITSGTIDSSGSPHDYVFQENQTNMEFLRERATRNGFELFVQDGKLNFRKPKAGSTLELKWLQDIHSFRVRVSSTEQVSAVEVRGWDYKQKKAIVSKANAATVLTSTQYQEGKKTSSAFSGQPSKATMIVVDKPVFSNKEADTIAQSLCNELGGEFVHADAVAEGNPDIRTGKVVQFSDMGKYSGKYYITEARHLYQEGIYTTEFSVRGLRADDISTTVAPETRLEPGQTMMVGVVSNNNDPDGLGRVRVKFPTLTEEHESNWARVVAIGGGPDRGFDCLPEINDEVLVAFEHGDIHRPYIIGGVWNGKDKPPEKVAESVANGKVRLRTIKTRLGHKLQFVEEDKGSSKKGIYIETVDGEKHKLHLNDTDKKIEMKTSGSHYLLLDDKNKKLETKTNGGHTVLMDDNGSKKIDITSVGDMNVKTGSSGKTRALKVNGGEIQVTGTTKILLKVGVNSIEISTSGIKISGLKVEVLGQKGVDIKSPMKVAIQGASAVNVQSAGKVEMQAGGAVKAQAGGKLDLLAGMALSATAGGALSLTGGASASITSGASFQVTAGATAGILAPLIRLNC
ncbi:VgrG-related protein [Phormidium pseudopriestleyi FRX01]|uniref:VgrG-related protein n=1 Tax=Phormidium pseudopriestleyi FRX01 TaxID=1759528 RepID=A0ABS3FMD5_9CYAN|nr:VgrG-related protein [Phormidium pseudopriestleyi]MBO0348273.1 VgrG-related protein [Phormidium pseudopriestleyi FRX01]